MTTIEKYNEPIAAVQNLTDAVSKHNGSNSLIGLAAIKAENTKVKNLLVRHRVLTDKPKFKRKVSANVSTHIKYLDLAR